VLKVKHQGIRAIAATIVAYYPGTAKVRMTSDSNYQGTVANFYRIDGTLSSTMSITTYNLVVRYFDAAGEKICYTQLWGLKREDGKTSFDLWRVAEFDKDGETRRELSFENGRLQQDDRTDVTIGGVDYDSVTLKYRPDGKLDSVELTPRSGHPSTSDVAAESLRSEVPPQELEADLGEDLPIPPLPVAEHQGGR
jgi:hypothetical protein